MSDDIEQRLTAAPEVVREREVTARRYADRQARQETLLAEVSVLRAESALEREDVELLEGLSLTRVLAARGAMASVVKHERMDEAAQAAAEADQRLAVLRTELADVGEPGLTAPQLTIGDSTKFVDVWFDNFFTDMAVRDRINQARQNVDNSADLVGQVQARLRDRLAGTQARLAAIEAERRDLLAG